MQDLQGSFGGIVKYLPLKMHPCYKEYLWGGSRLKKEYGKVDAPDVTAESWELASHHDGVSTVAEGLLAGKTIADLGVLDRAGFWGTQCVDGHFPLLIKLIDANKDLSIQVHPSDDTACLELGECGKAEMWYIVDCEPKAGIYYGFSQKITPEEFLRRAQDGSICKVLNRVTVSKGDVFYILPGMIHAIGAGVVIAEIQQNSNTTFRVYDYQRKDAHGQMRPLHLERAAQVMNYEPVIPEECKVNNITAFPEFTLSEMFTCRYFRAYKVDVHDHINLTCDGTSFHHVLCVSGMAQLHHQNQMFLLHKGDSYFLPASLGDYQITGKCRVLLSRL